MHVVRSSQNQTTETNLKRVGKYGYSSFFLAFYMAKVVTTRVTLNYLTRCQKYLMIVSKVSPIRQADDNHDVLRAKTTHPSFINYWFLLNTQWDEQLHKSH
jgi:hypothetical protein